MQFISIEKVLPYIPSLHVCLPCCAVDLCLLPSMFGQAPLPLHRSPSNPILFHNRFCFIAPIAIAAIIDISKRDALHKIAVL
jgi:hypothetical protein